MASLLSELRRRNVLKVAAAYALVAWILIEAGSVLLPTFGAPDWFFKVYVVIIFAGFVVAMIFAWVFEITPEGVKLDSNVDRTSDEVPTRSGLNVVIIGLLAVALSVSIGFNVSGIRHDKPTPQAAGERRGIAVLPFDNRSSDPDSRYFTDGIHDDLLTRLADIESLRVISRTSVMEYRDTPKNLRQIGRELGVAAIVEGAVQQSGNQVRITVQLIDAQNDQHLWANTYDRELTMANVFEIQSEISSRIAASLRAALTPDDELRLASVPTKNLDAYTLYAGGRKNLYQRRFETLQQARRQFEQAIGIDPGYAAAYAGLAEAVMVLLVNHKAIAPGEAYEVASRATRTALELDPNLAEAHALVGLIETKRWAHRRIDDGNVRAAAAFRRAIELSPSLTNAFVWFASLREAEGGYDDAINLLTRALQTDPLSRIPYVKLPGLLAAKGRNRQTIELLLKGMDLFPDWPVPYNYMAEHLERLGRLDESLAWSTQGVLLSDDPLAGATELFIHHEFGDSEKIDEFVANFPRDHPLYPLGASYVHFLDEDYAAAIALLEPELDDTSWQVPFLYPMIVRSAIKLGNYDRAYEYLLQGFPALGVDAEINVDRQNLGPVVILAFLDQKRGNRRRAADLLQRALAFAESFPRGGLWEHGIRDVQILALQGRQEAALDALRDAVDEGFVSLRPFDMWGIDQDPLLDSLRGNARYERLRLELDAHLEALRRSAESAASSGDWQSLRDKARST